MRPNSIGKPALFLDKLSSRPKRAQRAKWRDLLWRRAIHRGTTGRAAKAGPSTPLRSGRDDNFFIWGRRDRSEGWGGKWLRGDPGSTGMRACATATRLPMQKWARLHRVRPR